MPADTPALTPPPSDLLPLRDASRMVDRSLSTIRAWVRDGTLRGYREDPAHPSTSRVMVSREELARLVVEAGKASAPGRRPPGTSAPEEAPLEAAVPSSVAPVAPVPVSDGAELLRARTVAAELRGDLRAALAERDGAREVLEATRRTVEALEARCRDLADRADAERRRADGQAERVEALEAERDALHQWHGLPWYRRLLAAPRLQGSD